MRLSKNVLTSLFCVLLAVSLLPNHLEAAPKQRLADQSKSKASATAPKSRQTAKPVAQAKTKVAVQSKTRPATKPKAGVTAQKSRSAKPVVSTAKSKKRQHTAATSPKKVRSTQTAQNRPKQPPTKKKPVVVTRSGQVRKQPTATARTRAGTPQNIPSIAAITGGVALPVPRDSIFNPIEAPLKLTSRSYMVMDAVSGGTILAKNPDAPRQPASTIKILTGMIALKSLGSNDAVPVSRRAAGMPSSKVHLQAAKTYRATDLINSVLLASANDASVALAERIAGNESRFAQLMTYSAQRWGAKNTVCRTASGLTAEGQQSTARDLAQLFRVAMQDREFARRMNERSMQTNFGKTLRNHNKALWQLDGAMGGKTGYTNAARQTYVGQFNRNGHTIVVAIMGSETMWADLEKLVDYGFKRKSQEMARMRSQNRL
ncbi:MAG: D-alanyl-D-alanine carboxypeptidase [Desulfobulbaceae bacterium]|nr:D-alanyl-D-alanine carboxypeptidase [Desulfobulbaceae bacterium]